MPVRKPDPNTCPIHREQLDYGCTHCDVIAAHLALVLIANESFERANKTREPSPLTASDRVRYARLVVRHCASDIAGSCGASEIDRAWKSMDRAARLLAGALDARAAR